MPRFADEWELRRHYEHMLNARLREYGAATFGSIRRREQRLDRFRAAELKQIESEERLAEAREAAQNAIRQRVAQRAAEILAMVDDEPHCLNRLWTAIQNGFVRVKRG